jgi:hypothetical protein
MLGIVAIKLKCRTCLDAPPFSHVLHVPSCFWCAGISDWEAAAAAHAATAAKRRFNASSGHKEQVMSQVANLHRMAAITHEGGLW